MNVYKGTRVPPFYSGNFWGVVYMMFETLIITLEFHVVLAKEQWLPKWWFPEIGYPQIIHFKRIFHHKPTILEIPHLWKPPNGFLWKYTPIPPGLSWRVRPIFSHRNCRKANGLVCDKFVWNPPRCFSPLGNPPSMRTSPAADPGSNRRGPFWGTRPGKHTQKTSENGHL